MYVKGSVFRITSKKNADAHIVLNVMASACNAKIFKKNEQRFSHFSAASLVKGMFEAQLQDL